jgi:hypothetical protein
LPGHPDRKPLREFCTELCAEAVRRGIPVIVDVDRAMSLREGLLERLDASGVLQRAAAGDSRESDDGLALKKVAN